MRTVEPADGREPDALGFAVIAALGAALSLAVTGYVFGFGNNLFHLPIIGRLYDEPQFRTDAYMQSLRFFAAGPFQLLQGADRYVDPSRLFLILDYLSRLLSFVGFLACARLLGVTTRRDRSLFAVLLAFTTLLHRQSFAGGGGLFIEYFTHSEIANGLSLIAIYYAARGRLAEAFAANGLVFFTNAFVAVWNAGPLGLVIGLLLVRRRISPAQVLRRGGIGLVIFLIIASPVIANVLSNPDFARPTSFDYQTFLTQYWPFHFLFQWIPLLEKLGLAVTIATGMLAFIALGRRADIFQAALWGYIAVYAIGIIVPAVTSSAAILNLHLLRSGTGIHLLAALGSVALATAWQTSRDPRQSRVFGPLLIVTLCTLNRALMLAPLVIAAALICKVSRRLPSLLLEGRPATQIVLVILLLGFWPYAVWKSAGENAATEDHIAQWTAVGSWARDNTRRDAVFLVPTAAGTWARGDTRADAVFRDLRDSALRPNASSEIHEISLGSEIFEYVSQRRVWVDFKRGAAVMWSPSYYPVWRERVTDMLRLSSLDEELAYAARKGVTYVVDGCFQSGGRQAVFRTGKLCVFDATVSPDSMRASSGG